MVALRSHAGARHNLRSTKASWAAPQVITLVVSTSPDDKAQLQTQVLQQARVQLKLPQLQALQTVIDKRATFACTPQVQRPGMQIAPGLWACGDYVDGPYPATLEGAVRSGMQVAHALAQTAFAS